MRTPWQWLLDRTGITAKIKKLETKIIHTQDTVRQRDGQIVKLHKCYSDARDVSIEYQKSEQCYKKQLKTIRDAIPTLIRFDPVKTSHGTYGMVSDALGEYVKYKALEILFLESR